MAKYASFYAPINQALQNFNAQMNENNRRRDAALHRDSQAQLAAAQFNAQMNDPRRVLAMKKASDELAPTVLNVSKNMPSTMGADKFAAEQWVKFKPHIASIVGDDGVQIKENGDLVGSDGTMVSLPAYKARKVQNRINAAQMFEFDGETRRRQEIGNLTNEINTLKDEYKKTKNPATQMKIKGMTDKLGKISMEYENPQRRLIALRGKLSQIDRAMYQAYADGGDPGWTSLLKDQATRTQDEYNALLKSMGKTGDAKGIQLKRYRNPTTGQVVDIPVSKFDGAAYSRSNPIVGGVKHLGTFVLDNPSVGSASPAEQYKMYEGYISDYEKRGRQITALKNSLVKDASGEQIIKSMNITDPDMIALIAQAKTDKDAVNQQIADLEAARKRLETDAFKLFSDKTVRGRLEEYFGKQIDDPAGLLDTPTGSKVLDTLYK
jgi:hypothetical protein